MEDRINEVFEVFKDYYGEDRVDLQDHDILVHFPRVTVTNENNESIEVTDIYIKTPIHEDGTINGVFSMTRGSYTLSQVNENYLHSHAYSIPNQDNEFSRCCTGTGPIVRTMSLLAEDCDLDRWALYCFELDKYTQVESVAGVPYHYLNRVSRSNFGTSTIDLIYSNVSLYNFNPKSDILTEFVPYLISKRLLRFSIQDDHYAIAHSFIDYISIITTAFVEYIKEKGETVDSYIDRGFLTKGQYKDGKFVVKTSTTGYRGINPVGRIACTFKGQPVIVTVHNDLISSDDSKDIIIDKDIANYLLYKILAILNYGSTKDNNSPEEERTIII